MGNFIREGRKRGHREERGEEEKEGREERGEEGRGEKMRGGEGKRGERRGGRESPVCPSEEQWETEWKWVVFSS